jgi:hypothetical protein
MNQKHYKREPDLSLIPFPCLTEAEKKQTARRPDERMTQIFSLLSETAAEHGGLMLLRLL